MILQNLTRDGIPNRYLSVDRTDEAGVYTKSLLQAGVLKLPYNKLLLREASELRRVGSKLDHPATGAGGMGSKDIFDAVSGVVFDLYQNLDLAGQLSVKYKVSAYANQVDERMRSGNNDFEDMLHNIY